jgi:DNA-damage-inducible protein J
MSVRISTLQIRVDDATKQQAKAALDANGLSLSEAIRIFLKRIAADQAFPFMPNADTRAAMAEAEQMLAEHSARFKLDG